jgi:hypothetical protein
MPDPQTQTSAEITNPERERDPLLEPDAAEIVRFDEEAAQAEVEEGKKSFEQLFTQGTEIVPRYDREPGLQTKELDQYAIGLGFLMSERIQQNSELTYEQFLQSLRENESLTARFTQEITGTNANTEMGIYLNEYLPEYFDFVKELTTELEKNKDNPNFLDESVSWLQEQAQDITTHPDGMRQGLYEKAKQGLTSTIDPTAEAGENIFEYIKKNPKKLLVSGAVIIGTLMVGKWLFGKKNGLKDSATKGIIGKIAKWSGLGALGLLGGELLTKIWNGKSIGDWFQEKISNTLEGATASVKEKTKDGIVMALSTVMPTEAAQKMVDTFMGDEEDEGLSSGKSKDDKEESREPSALAEAAEEYSPEWLKNWWNETMKPNIITWLTDNLVDKRAAEEALDQFDIVKLAEEYIRAGGGIIKKASRSVIVVSTGLMTASFALFALKKTIPFLVKNTFRVGKFAAIKIFRHPLVAVLGGLGVALGASSASAQEVAEEEVKKIFGSFDRELLPEEEEFFEFVSKKTEIPKEYLEKVGGMRLKDFLSMGDHILKQAGEASGIFNYQEEWHTHFATLYDFLMEKNRRDELDGLFSGEIDRKMTVAGALAILLGDSEIQQKSKQADEDQKNIGMIEAGWEQAEFSVLHKGIADFVDALPEDVQEKIHQWDTENPNLRGTISRATKVFDIIAGNGYEAWFSAGTVILKKGAGIFVYPLVLAEDLAKNMIGGEWEEVALDAAEGFAAMTTVKILTKVKYKTQLLVPVKIIGSLTQLERVLPRTGFFLENEQYQKLIHKRNAFRRTVTQKSIMAEHKILAHRLAFYRKEFQWAENKHLIWGKDKYMDEMVQKARDLFFNEIKAFENKNGRFIPPEKSLLSIDFDEFWKTGKMPGVRLEDTKPGGSAQKRAPIVPEMVVFTAEYGLKKAQTKIGELEAKGTLDASEKKQLAMLKSFRDGELKTATAESVRSLPEAQRGERLHEMAEELIEREKGFNARMRFDLDEIARHAEKNGLSMESKEIQDMVEAVNKKIKAAARSKLKNIYVLNRLYGELPKSAQTPELKSSLKNAMYTPGESLFLKFKKAAKGRAVIAAVMGGIMVGTKILTYEDDPEKSADEEIAATLAEMGPEAVQILLDILPFVGTYSTARAAITGEEWVTDRDVSSFGDRTMNTLFSIAGGAADIFTVATFGTGAAANLAARAGVLTAKMGTRGPKILNAVKTVLPKLTRIADKIGWERFAGKFVDILKTGLNPAKMQKVAGAAAIAGTTVMVGNVTMGILYVNEGEVDPDEIHADLQPE